MKKTLLSLAAIICSMQLTFASTEQYDTIVIKHPKLSVEQQREILMQTRHEVRAGSCLFGASSFESLLSSTNLYTTNHITLPSISVEYTYRAVEFLEVGAFFALNHYSFTLNDYNEDSELTAIENWSSDDYGIVAFARYSWLNRRYIQLYTSVGMGVNISTAYGKDIKTGEVSTASRVSVLPEFIPIGVRFGGRLFGYFEPFGYSARGIIFNLGMGFRF